MKAGVAEQIYFPELTTNELKEKLTKVLTKKIYAENMKLCSKRFRDQPEKPLDRAVWWIEYIMRNPNADHLRSPVLRLGFIRGNSLDLFGILMLAVIGVLFGVVCVGWKIAAICSPKRRSDAKIKIN